jgi:hypothetical protein
MNQPSLWDIMWQGRTILYTIVIVLLFHLSLPGCFLAWVIIAALRQMGR